MSEEKENINENEIYIHKACDFFNCYYGLKKVPKQFKPAVEQFLKEHGGHWHSLETHPDRGVSTFYYFIETPPKANLPWEELEKKLNVKIFFVFGDFYHGCDSETTDDPDVWFS